jgi:Sec-independent protein translocase protein TatA
MFHVGFSEIVVILVVIIIAVKPENLPDFIGKIRKIYVMFKETIMKVKAEVSSIERKIQNEIDELEPKNTVETQEEITENIENNSTEISGTEPKPEEEGKVTADSWFIGGKK